MQALRQAELYKLPGVAETLDWAAALLALDQKALSPAMVDDTLGVILRPGRRREGARRRARGARGRRRDGGGQLLHNLLVFGRLVRGLGLDVSAGTHARPGAAALAHVEIGSPRSDVRDAARCLPVRRHEDLPLFDAAFDAFWRDRAPQGLDRPRTSARAGGPASAFASRAPPRTRWTGGGALRDEPDHASERAALPARRAQLQSQDVLRHKDFAELTGAELDEVRRLVLSLRWRLGQRISRRRRPGDGSRMDLRRTLRGSLRAGNSWSLRFRAEAQAEEARAARRHLRLDGALHPSCFCSVRLQTVFRQVGTFAFWTRLTRITRQLRARAYRQVLAAPRRVPDWSGGTRIGEALRDSTPLGRHVGRGCVVVLSDGWDRASPSCCRRNAALSGGPRG